MLAEAPRNVQATAGDTQAIVSFLLPEKNGGAPITQYVVISDPENITVAGTTSPITMHGLRNGVSYTFRVLADTVAGSGPWSEPSNSVTLRENPPTMYTIVGPSEGDVDAESEAFTVTPDHSYTGTITITPSGAASSGLSPIVLTFDQSKDPQMFRITPSVDGTITLTGTNDGELDDPSPIEYLARKVIATTPTALSATRGNTQVSHGQLLPMMAVLPLPITPSNTNETVMQTGQCLMMVFLPIHPPLSQRLPMAHCTISAYPLSMRSEMDLLPIPPMLPPQPFPMLP